MDFLSIDLTLLSPYLWGALLFSCFMLLWDTIEVGRNDAANIVNSVFGSRILSRKWAVLLAGIGVILGAYLSSDVIETARKGIFSPAIFTIEAALAIYVAVYLVDTLLLYSYSAFGMPVSTTMTLVFELLGAALFLDLVLGNPGEAIHWSKAGTVIGGIVCSIFLSGVLGFFLQRAARGAIGNRWNHFRVLILHGPWVAGGLLSGLTYFMLVKGMKNVEVVKNIKENLLTHPYGPFVAIIVLWVIYAAIIHVSLVVFRERAAKRLFPILTVLGMIAMAFAFGQNDLANCASPGLASLKLIEGQQQGLTTAAISKVPISSELLLMCGFLLVVGMMTKNADRVTKAEVRTGSRTESHVKLYAPSWCIRIGERIVQWQNGRMKPLSKTSKPKKGHTTHYDPLRASVIVCVSACVIATASSLKLPVSTTYVAFAAVIATGIADRIFVHGEAALKLGRSIWVIFSWFAAAIMASVGAGIVCIVIYYSGLFGMVACLLINLTIRQFIKYRADDQEARLRREEEKILT